MKAQNRKEKEQNEKQKEQNRRDAHGRSARIGYTLLTVLVIVAGICTGVWIGTEPNAEEMAAAQAKAKETPIYFVETEEQKIALSFDATWGKTSTQAILDVLAAHSVRATFFLTNLWMEEYPDMARKIADAGHEIGMHSVSHPHMAQLSDDAIRKEVANNAAMIRETTQYAPELFRFPFGEYDNESLQIVRQMGYYPIQWSVDSLDWQESKTKDDIVNRIAMGLHPGAIILCHNNGTYTAEAIAELIPYAMEAGYTFVPVGELIYKGEYVTDHQGMQQKP